jgi:hypothetical protein
MARPSRQPSSVHPPNPLQSLVLESQTYDNFCSNIVVHVILNELDSDDERYHTVTCFQSTL